MMRVVTVIAVVLVVAAGCSAFQQAPAFARSTSLLMAKKGKAGQGFGAPAPKKVAPSAEMQEIGLTSIEEQSGAAPVLSTPATPAVDSSLPPEERTKQILRDQYGLRTLEDTQREEKLKEQRLKVARLVKEAEKEDFDIMMVLPPPVIMAVDRFLKAGLAICTLTFIAAGCGITAEAYAAASQNPLPENIDDFIVNVVEPNFTPGLFVLLAFSVSLGVFSALQLGSGSSQYKEM